MMIATLRGHRQHIREFIDAVLEAHMDPSVHPTLGGLADCLTDEEPAWLPRDEPLAVEPECRVAHPAGRLFRTGGGDVWAHLPETGCYLHIPGGFAVYYKFEISGDYAALALQASPQLPGPELSENFIEVPVARMIIDAAMIMILMPDHSRHNDVEILVS
jgi:hypothetical protein